MKITVFYSSIHKERGNTYVIVDTFVQGARAGGAEVEIVLLADKKISPCQGCIKCWTKTPGSCVLKDDMAGLLEKFMRSDLVVMATPVYAHNVNGIMKNFLDRLIPVIDPHMEKRDYGLTGHLKRYPSYPRLGVIATGGFPEQQCCEFVSLYIHRLAKELYSEVSFEIYKGQGGLLRMEENEFVAALVEEYKKNVFRAGQEVAKQFSISPGLVQSLEQPFLPEDIYIEEANKYFDRMMENNR